ncbi:MAG: gamma-glutamylcyclotransferase [Gammaproteobacteria bacterium]|nr:MAG: gamma-glutamylcyclotransferase [Gammaproteobacteria bacterium]
MTAYYFAYGSNMNPLRMQARGLVWHEALPARLPRHGLRFNKRAADRPLCAYANVVYAPAETVEGVLYRLDSTMEVAKLDEFEGTPRLYSREVFLLETDHAVIPAWVYIANPAVIQQGLLPEAWYMQHVLAGRDYLSEPYYQRLQAQPAHPVYEAPW